MVADAGGEDRILAGRYRLGARIGAGGMGAVHRAFDVRLERAVAIKLLPAAQLGDRAARQRLRREALAGAALGHPGIVHVYDVGETDEGGAFLVMELVRGRSLRALVDDPSWPAGARLVSVVEAARALAAAHRAGLVHRDVKPDNLMLREDGRVVLLDFGIARTGDGEGGGEGEGGEASPGPEPGAPAEPLAGGVAAKLTGAGVVMGTPAYLSPEQAQGKPLDGRTDQFSLAVTAFELLTGGLPWPEPTAVGLVRATLVAPTPSLRLADAALADAVRPVIERAMSKEPADRYPDADAFADALARAAGLAPTASGSLAVPGASPSGVQSARPSASGSRSGAPASLSDATAERAFDPLAATAPAGISAACAADVPTDPATDGSTNPATDAHARTLAAPVLLAPARRWARWAWPAAGAAIAIAIAAAAFGVARARSNPLDAAYPVLACPALEGAVDGKPAPWLGAAAAYALGDDLAPMLGGLDDHVRYPAALLDLPGYAEDARDLDPWAAPELRERTVRAAAAAGLAWLDGRVEARGARISLTVVVRAPSGRELGRASGEGVGLSAVALDVSRRLRAAGALGRPRALDPAFRAWQGVASAEEQDAAADLRLAMVGRTPEGLCKVALPPRLPAPWRAAIDGGCAGGPLDLSLPAPALARAIAASPQAVPPEARERFQQAAALAPPGQRRAVALGASLRLGEQGGADGQARLLAVVAASPRTGWSAVDEGLTTASPTLISNALVWAPDDADWWLTATRALPAGERAGASRLLQREFVLLPDGPVAALYADSLLREGDTRGLSPVVAYLTGSEDAQHRELGRFVAARAAVLEGAFARTLGRWTGELSAPGTRLGDAIDVTPRITSARELAYATSGERALAGAVARALADGAASLDSPIANVTLRPNLAALCALAEPALAARCLAALDAAGSASPAQREDWGRVRAMIDRYLAGDFPRAADAARGLMGSRYYPYYVVRLGDFLADVFDRGGVPDLADDIDRPRVDDRDLAGASLAALRAARRARARGDDGRARALAQRVVDAWRRVDMTVPAVAEMQALLSAPRR